MQHISQKTLLILYTIYNDTKKRDNKTKMSFFQKIVKLAVDTLWSNRYDWVLAMYIMGNSLINIIGKEIMKNETKTIFNAVSHCVCTNNNKWLY